MKTATIPMRLKTWQTPNFATFEMPAQPKQVGIRELPSIQVNEIPIDTLDTLAELWRQELYRKAGKPLPEDRYAAVSVNNSEGE